LIPADPTGEHPSVDTRRRTDVHRELDVDHLWLYLEFMEGHESHAWISEAASLPGAAGPEIPLWLAGIVLVAIPALAAYGLTELVCSKWLKPWRAERLAAGLPEPSWRWTALVGTVSAFLGACVGLGMATFDHALGVELLPVPPFWGLALGFVGGAQNWWLVHLIKRRTRRAVEDS
jgi:hypothetical protein